MNTKIEGVFENSTLQKIWLLILIEELIKVDIILLSVDLLFDSLRRLVLHYNPIDEIILWPKGWTTLSFNRLGTFFYSMHGISWAHVDCASMIFVSASLIHDDIIVVNILIISWVKLTCLILLVSIIFSCPCILLIRFIIEAIFFLNGRKRSEAARGSKVLLLLYLIIYYIWHSQTRDISLFFQ